MESPKDHDSFCSRSTGEEITPEVYFPESECEGVLTRERQVSAGGRDGPEGKPAAWTKNTDCEAELDGELEGGDQRKDLGEGFISITDLEEEDLPEEMRCEEALRLIKETANRVVNIVNNKMSNRRPQKFKFDGRRSIKGTGFLLWISDDYAIVSTNRHVLYDNEEIRNATLYLDYNEPNVIDGKRNANIRVVSRGKGLGALRGNQKEDFTLAVFSIEKYNLFQDENIPTLTFQTKVDEVFDKESAPKLVCVISHPLGQPKQVSFGRVLKESLDTGEYEHDAPTHPGSSGATILIFSRTPPEVPAGSVWYHIGKASRPGVKLARLQVNDSDLFDMNLEFVGKADLLSNSPTMSRAMALKVLSSINSIRRMSSWTCHGGAVLQPERFLSKLEEHPLTTCKGFVLHSLCSGGGDDEDEDEDDDEDSGTFFHAVFESSELCVCNALMRLVTSNDHLKNRQGEEPYLCPDSLPLCSSQHPTWPFGLQDLQQSSNLALYMSCVRWDFLDKNLKKMSLLELVNADPLMEDVDKDGNEDVLHSLMICLVAEELLSRMKKLSPSQADMGTPESTEAATERQGSTEVHMDESLKERRHACLELILDSLETFLKELDVDGAILVVMCSNFLNQEASNPSQQTHDLKTKTDDGIQPDSEIVIDSDEEVIYERVPRPHTTKKEVEKAARLKAISQALNDRHQVVCDEMRTLVNHVMQHCKQDHKDGVDCEGEWCDCGRPSVKRLMKALKHIRSLHLTRASKDTFKSAERVQKDSVDVNESSSVDRKETEEKERKITSSPCSSNSDEATQETRKDCPSYRETSEKPSVRVRCTKPDPNDEYAYVYTRNKIGDHTRVQSDPDDEYIYVRERNKVEEHTRTKSSQDEENVYMLARKDWEDHTCIEQDSESEIAMKKYINISVKKEHYITNFDADEFHQRKLLSQSRFCFFFHGQFMEDERSEDDDEDEAALLLQCVILALRRFFVATEVFLYNCQQFLSSFHDVMGCPCETLNSAARSHPLHCEQDDSAAPTHAGNTRHSGGQCEDPDIVSMEAMEDFVCTEGKFSVPGETFHSTKSHTSRSGDTERDGRVYASVEEAQIALGKTIEKSSHHFCSQLAFFLQSEITMYANLSSPYAIHTLCLLFLLKAFGVDISDVSDTELAQAQAVARQEAEGKGEGNASPLSTSVWCMICERLAGKVQKLVMDSMESSIEGQNTRELLQWFQRAAELLFLEAGFHGDIDLHSRSNIVEPLKCLEICFATNTSGLQNSVFSDLSPNLRLQIMQEVLEKEENADQLLLPFFSFLTRELAAADSMTDAANEANADVSFQCCLEKPTTALPKPAGAEFQHTQGTSSTALGPTALLCQSTSDAAQCRDSSVNNTAACIEPDPEDEYIYVCTRSNVENQTRTQSDSTARYPRTW